MYFLYYFTVHRLTKCFDGYLNWGKGWVGGGG